MGEYTNVKVKDSGPTNTPLRKQANQSREKTFSKQAPYPPPLQNTKGILVIKDARIIWEAAVIISPD